MILTPPEWMVINNKRNKVNELSTASFPYPDNPFLFFPMTEIKSPLNTPLTQVTGSSLSSRAYVKLNVHEILLLNRHKNTPMLGAG